MSKKLNSISQCAYSWVHWVSILFKPKNREYTACAIYRFFYLSFYNNMAGCVIIILDNLNLIKTSRTARIVVLTDYYVGVEIVKTF
jgi:hypothetical protein